MSIYNYTLLFLIIASLSKSISGSAEPAHLRPVKIEKGRRVWSVREEEILLSSLKELAALGYKSDNGFRTGYAQKLEEALRREFPNTDLKENPHISSKLTAWKRNYSSLINILSLSGAGFNLKGDYLVDISNEQWEHIMKVDSNARFIRNKPWRYLEDWKIIFGKDRANGDTVEGVKKAVNELDAQEAIGTSGEHSINLDKDDIMGEENDTVSVCQEKGKKGLKQGGRKRKGDDSTDPTFQLLSKMHSDTTESLKSVSSRIGYEIDLSNKRTKIVKILGGIPGLSQRDKFEAIRILLEKQEHLDVVIALPESERPDYITYILDVFQKK